MSQQLSFQPDAAEPDTGRGEHGVGRDAAADGAMGKAATQVLESVVRRDVLPALVAMPWMRRGPQTVLRRTAPTALRLVPASPPPVPLPAPVAAKPPRLTGRTVTRLVQLCLGADPAAVPAMLELLCAAGVTTEAIYLNLLTPAARRLGVMWETDACTFAEVTMGVLRLQNAQRALAPAFRVRPGRATVQRGAPRAMLMPALGEQHTFGLTIVADFFARAGWDTWSGVVESEAKALRMVRAQRLDMLGISFGSDERIEDAARLIRALRRAAANPSMLVMVGGPSFVAKPSLVNHVGADATALDGNQAVLQAHALLTRSPQTRLPSQTEGAKRARSPNRPPTRQDTAPHG